MERLQRSTEIGPNYLRSEITSRLKLQFNNGISNGTKKHDNERNRSPTTIDESSEIEAEDEDEEEDDEEEEEEEEEVDKEREYEDKEDHENDEINEESTANYMDINSLQKPMICDICHLSQGVAEVAGVSASPNPMLTCTQGHLLCRQCVYRYTVCSDVGCTVCGAELYIPKSTSYRPTNCRNARGLEPVRNIIRPLNQVEESKRSKNWPRNYSDAMSGTVLEPMDNGRMIYGVNTHRDANGCSVVYDGDSGDGTTQTNQTPNGNLKPRQHHRLRSYRSIVGEADLETEGRRRIGNSAREGNGNAVISHTECSRRPIRCPRLDCAVNVAFSALTHHFLFDHPEVPILSVEPGDKSTLIVSFAALSCDSSRCLALLLVSGKLTAAAARLFNGSQIQPRYRNRLPLPVLAARLHCSTQNPCNDETHAHGEGQGQGDIVVAWVAGLDVGIASTTGTLRCSIQAVDGNDTGELRSLTYTGPVNSLRTAQRPREVFKTGDCVILHQGLINHIASGCTNLNVNVIVH